jgi:hypothetical protein
MANLIHVEPYPTFRMSQKGYEPIEVPQWVWEAACDFFPSPMPKSFAVKKTQTSRWRFCKTVMAHLPKEVSNGE